MLNDHIVPFTQELTRIYPQARITMQVAQPADTDGRGATGSLEAEISLGERMHLTIKDNTQRERNSSYRITLGVRLTYAKDSRGALVLLEAESLGGGSTVATSIALAMANAIEDTMTRVQTQISRYCESIMAAQKSLAHACVVYKKKGA